MKTLLTTLVMGTLAGSALLGTAGAAGAQSKTLQGESTAVTVTIEAIDQATRTMTVKDAQGVYETLEVPAAFTRFTELKVGDKITARYYENVVIRVKKPNEAAVDLDTSAFTRGQGHAGRNARRAAHRHGDDDGDGSEGEVDHRHRPERLQVQPEGGRQQSVRAAEGR